MTEDVKRSYDASRRQELARQARARVLMVARRRFLEAGYRATPLAQIAAEADVSVQSINKNFRNKAGLLKALFEVALVGDDEPAPLSERDWIKAMLAEPDADEKLHRFATVLASMLPRTAPIQLLMREAAGDPAIATVWRQIRDGRLTGMTNLASNLAQGGHLRGGVTIDEARDVLWAYSSPELFELLVIERGWPVEQYRDYLEDGARAALLGAARSRS